MQTAVAGSRRSGLERGDWVCIGLGAFIWCAGFAFYLRTAHLGGTVPIDALIFALCVGGIFVGIPFAIAGKRVFRSAALVRMALGWRVCVSVSLYQRRLLVPVVSMRPPSAAVPLTTHSSGRATRICGAAPIRWTV